MPRKNNNTPEVRLMQRENQRRSRMRQKELIDEMRQRIEQYKRDGIQATASMQLSARLVDAENKALRSLLAAKGVTLNEIHDHLRLNGISPLQAPDLMIKSGTEIPTPAGRDDFDAMSSAAKMGCVPHHVNRDIADGRRREQDGSQMSCDVAASIVADVADHGDREYVMSKLGCTTPDCTVKTSHVFDIIDQATLY